MSLAQAALRGVAARLRTESETEAGLEEIEQVHRDALKRPEAGGSRQRCTLPLDARVITAESISAVYRVPPEQVQIVPLPLLHAIKTSFPVTAGGFEDRDQRAGLRQIPLSRLVIPPRPPVNTRRMMRASP